MFDYLGRRGWGNRCSIVQLFRKMRLRFWAHAEVPKVELDTVWKLKVELDTVRKPKKTRGSTVQEDEVEVLRACRSPQSRTWHRMKAQEQRKTGCSYPNWMCWLFGAKFFALGAGNFFYIIAAFILDKNTLHRTWRLLKRRAAANSQLKFAYPESQVSWILYFSISWLCICSVQHHSWLIVMNVFLLLPRELLLGPYKCFLWYSVPRFQCHMKIWTDWYPYSHTAASNFKLALPTKAWKRMKIHTSRFFVPHC